MSYERKRLGDYIDILPGYAFKSNTFSEVGIPIIKIKNIMPPYVNLEDTSFVPKEEADAHSKYHLKYNDVLIALTGSHINQMASVVGRVARVKYNSLSLLNQRVGKVTVKNFDICDINFVYYFLSQESTKITLASKAGGAANQANISPADVKNLMIPFPGIEIQHRIADILSAYDDLIENNQKQIILLEEAAQRLYKEWFVDLRFPCYEDVSFEDGIPVGWRKEIVGNLIGKVPRTKQIMSSEYKKEGMIPIIDQSREFIAGYTDDNEARIEVSVEPIIVFGDHTRILKLIQFPFAKGADGTQLIISCNSNMPQRLLYCSLVNIDLSNYHYARHFKYLKAEQILVPTIEIANQFEEITKGLYAQVQVCRNRILHAQNARDRLLPKLMSGELKV